MVTGWVRAVPPTLPTIPTNVFNVTNYGAVGNGVTGNSAAIQAAVDAVGAAGGGTLEFPPGTFLSGPFTLTSNLRFQLDAGAVLLMLPYGTYPGGSAPPHFISGNKLHDIEFCGPGTIEGQGQPWWDAKLSAAQRPYMIHLRDFQRLLFHEVHLQNAPMKHIVLDGKGGNVTVQDLVIHEPENSPNTDGLNLQGTNCLVQNCDISVGDDNIALGRSSGPGADILITNITCGTGHGISIGSITSAGISNVTVTDCTFNGTRFGLRLKADNDRGGLVQNINYSNIRMTNVEMPILIYSFYNEAGSGGKIARITPAKAASYAAEPVNRRTPIWRDITFSNIMASATIAGGAIWGRAEMLISNVTLDHVNFTAPKGFNIYNARDIKIVDSEFHFSTTNDFTLHNGQVTVTNRAATASR